MSIKKLHREIMLSAVYQLSAEHVAANADKDSGNRLYWRANRAADDRRADSRLDAVRVRRPRRQRWAGPPRTLTPLSTGARSTARSAAIGWISSSQLFDFPAPTISAEQRFTTNVPLQRLFFMNSDFMQQQAELLAQTRRGRARQPVAHPQGVSPDLRPRSAAKPSWRPASRIVTQEPMRAYEERKAPRVAKKPAEDAKVKDARDSRRAADAGKPTAMTGDGMMAGVVPAPARTPRRRSCCR